MGPQIDPGYRGRLIVGLANPTPSRVILTHNQALLSVQFHRLDREVSKPYDGPYQDKYELGSEELEFILEQESLTLPEVLETLNTLSANVAALSADVSVLKWSIPVLLAIGSGVIAILVAIK